MAVNSVGNLVLIDGTMSQEQYEKILVENVKQSAKKFSSFYSKMTIQGIEPGQQGNSLPTIKSTF